MVLDTSDAFLVPLGTQCCTGVFRRNGCVKLPQCLGDTGLGMTWRTSELEDKGVENNIALSETLGRGHS